MQQSSCLCLLVVLAESVATHRRYVVRVRLSFAAGRTICLLLLTLSEHPLDRITGVGRQPALDQPGSDARNWPSGTMKRPARPSLQHKGPAHAESYTNPYHEVAPAEPPWRHESFLREPPFLDDEWGIVLPGRSS